MGRKKSPTSAKVVKESLPLDNFMKLIFKKFKLTDRQKEFLSIAFDPNTKVVFLSGPSGSSKTFCSVYAALHLFNMDQEKEIIYVRTTAESGERSLGFLPGSSDEKLNPFTIPLLDKLEEIVGRDSAKELIVKRIATASPINFLRGVSWNNKLVILDESQNATYKELVTFLTRIGKETKYFLCGDLMQSDINGKSGLKKVIDTFDTKEAQENGIHVFNFTKDDIMRSEILKFIVNELEKNI
jgi:phosphate starvation-inducible protein PhoH and related proteins